MKSRQSDYAVLGMLTLGPASGYEVKSLIERSIGHFWSESYGQIYPTLERLETEGLARRQGRAANARSTTYAITAPGRRRLKEWLAGPPSKAPYRDGMLLRLFFGHELGAEQCLQVLEDYRATARGRLAAYRRTEKELRAVEAENRNLPFWLITLRSGQLGCESSLRWCEESIAALQALGRRRKSPATTPKSVETSKGGRK